MNSLNVLNDKLYSVNLDKIPFALEGYEVLGLKHEPLRLITPEFETPLPPLQPAVSNYAYNFLFQNIFKLILL